MKKIFFGVAILILVTDEIKSQTSSIDTLYYLKDRGEGMATSMFGTYINNKEVIIYPFYEFYYDDNAEYKPAELGHSLNQDFRGRYRAHEGLLFLGYGISDRWAVEMEVAIITATLYKSPEDNSTLPAEFSESGLGDVEGQLRYRWNRETNRRPELFSYFETVFPLQKNKTLIGTQSWEFKLGSGLIKGFHWGTMTFRAAVEYDTGEKKLDIGEMAIEYLKNVSKTFRFGIMVEGAQDEVELIADLQFHISPHAFIRLNNGFGITSKATDYAPEIGVLFHF
jgi:hypothetical protein